MAMTSPPAGGRHRSGPLGSRLHFLVRLLGLTGLLTAYAGVMLAAPARPDDLPAALTHLDPTTRPGLGGLLLLLGWLAALAALAVEVVAALRVVAGRRSAFGANAVVQVLLAALLLVGVNVWSFRHPERFDWTREQQFTLPADVRERLAALDPRGETTIVLYLRHRTSSTSADKPDPFDLEAERKVVEKVKDLVELFREVGAQFRVEVLDVGEKGYPDRLAALTADAPALRRAIEEAPENSIFVRAGDHVQRMSFNEFYRLDRSASQERDNLVLRAVGAGPLSRRVVGVEERVPRLGVLVFHEALSSEGPVNLFTLAGARKALQGHGFDVRDVVLRGANGEPAADSLEVSKLERLQDEVDDLDAEARVLEREIGFLERLVKALPKEDIREINRQIIAYAEQFNPRFVLLRAREGDREALARLFGNQLAAAREGLELAREERGEVRRELGTLNADRVSEQRRLKDLRAKLTRTLADVDLLLVPRLTLLQSGDPISNPSLHDLEARQARAVRAFLRDGKPLLACFGPTNMPSAAGRPGGDRAIKEPDELEKMLAELGIVFGKRTVLFNVEKRAFAGRDENLLRANKSLQVPGLRLEPAARSVPEALQQTAHAPVRESMAAVGTGPAGPLAALPFLQPLEPPAGVNPVLQSLQLADAESGQRLNLRLRFLRPVFIDPLRLPHMHYPPEVLSTSAASWHDEQPFSTAVRPVPRFEPPAPDDPDNGTLEARRRGPFSVGVAVETTVPPEWSGGEKPRTVRVAALGQAGLISGPELSAGQERLLVDTCNWLLGRDERLARPAPEWSYPRLALSEDERSLWLWAARQGLPVLFAYLGLVVLLLRRLR